MEKLVVTRYHALFQYLKEIGLIDEDTKVLSHAKGSDVIGRHVLGVLPYWLSSLAEKYTEVQVRVPIEMKGKELTLEQMRFYSLKPKTYQVREVPFEDEV